MSFLPYLARNNNITVIAIAIAISANASGDNVGMPAGLAGMMAMVVLEVLLAGVSSPWSELTVAVFWIVPGVVGRVTMRVMVAVAFGASVPTLHVTVDVPLQVPWVDVAEVRVVPAGRTSVTVVPVAVAGPLFVTTIV